MSELTAKQERFVEEYLIDLNATQAAIRAGYSEKTARSQGQRMLTNVDIEAAIAAGARERTKRTEITQDMVVRELAKIAFSDLRNVLTIGGHLIDPHKWDEDLAGAVSSFEVVKANGADEGAIDYTHKIKLWDKLSALEKLGKHLGMFVERVEVKTSPVSAVPLTEKDWTAKFANAGRESTC